MSDHITASERRALAAAAGVNEQYLYQCLTGRRDMDPAEAVRVERVSGRRLCRWHLRRDWAQIWPELVKMKGAPKSPSFTVG